LPHRSTIDTTSPPHPRKTQTSSLVNARQTTSLTKTDLRCSPLGIRKTLPQKSWGGRIAQVVRTGCRTLQLIDPACGRSRERIAIWHVRLQVEHRCPVQKIEPLHSHPKRVWVHADDPESRECELRRAVRSACCKDAKSSFSVASGRSDERAPACVEMHVGYDPAVLKSLKAPEAVLESEPWAKYHVSLECVAAQNLLGHCRLSRCPESLLVRTLNPSNRLKSDGSGPCMSEMIRVGPWRDVGAWVAGNDGRQSSERDCPAARRCHL